LRSTEIRVRFCETDALGHVNNTSYFAYLEEARLDFLEETHLDHCFILASTRCDFVAQAYYNQKLVVTTSIKKIGTKSFTLSHEIIDKYTSKLIAQAEAVVVYFNFDTQQSEPLPRELRNFLHQHLVETESVKRK